MVAVAIGKKVVQFESAGEIAIGLRRLGNLRLAAVNAAGRYIYQPGEEKLRQDIVEEIWLIAVTSNNRDTHRACQQAMESLNFLLAARLQNMAPAPRVAAAEPSPGQLDDYGY